MLGNIVYINDNVYSGLAHIYNKSIINYKTNNIVCKTDQKFTILQDNLILIYVCIKQNNNDTGNAKNISVSKIS